MNFLYIVIIAVVLAVQPVTAGAFFDNLIPKNFLDCSDDNNPCIWDNLGAAIPDGVFTNAGKNIFAQYPIATRLFSGPTQYPPPDYAAYGILAFTVKPAPQELARYVTICTAYINTLPSAFDTEEDKDKQLVTVWPVTDDAVADKLNKKGNEIDCNDAVANYNHILAKQAISAAQKGGWQPSGIGPFLIAWAPGATLGQKDAAMLVINLSNVVTYEQAQAIMTHWANDIENDKSTWDGGFTVDSLRKYLQLWADTFGPDIWRLIKI